MTTKLCKQCKKEIKSNLILSCTCGQFCSLKCRSNYHKDIREKGSISKEDLEMISDNSRKDNSLITTAREPSDTSISLCPAVQERTLTIVNLGLGVNSTAILALIKLGRLTLENPIVVFADVGAEKPQTYEYLEYLKEITPLPINIVRATEKDGNLFEYCKKNKILPQRYMRWCTDRWKRKPLEKFRKEQLKETDNWKVVIGIAYDEKHRASRWANDKHSLFPLIDLKMTREDCIKVIKEVGWKVPVKSGCWFCPFAPLDEFVELKKTNLPLYKELCQMEKDCLAKNSWRIKGWFNDKYPLDDLLARKRPISVAGQQCLYCFDGDFCMKESKK